MREADSPRPDGPTDSKSERNAGAVTNERNTLTPPALSNPTYRCVGVAASSVIAPLAGSSNCVSSASPDPFGATSDQSAGSHTPSAPGAQAHSCGPATVLRAAYRRPPKATTAGKA